MDGRETSWAARMQAGLAGDGTTYERLLGDIAQVVRIIVRRRLSRLGLNTTEMEDVVQEILLGLHLKRHTWDSARPILPWIHAIARHKLSDAVRRMRRDRRVHVDLPIEDWADRLPAPPSFDPDRSGLDIERILALLPSMRQRQIVRALTLEGETVRSVADRFGSSEGAVRVTLHRGLARLAERIGALGARSAGG